MTLLETVLISWFSAGLVVVLLVGARGVLHDTWTRATGRRRLQGGPGRPTVGHQGP